MYDINFADDQHDNIASKARDFRVLESDEAIRKHPDLANAYAVVKAAELVAEIQLALQADRQLLASMMKETVAERIERREPLPVVRDLFSLPHVGGPL